MSSILTRTFVFGTLITSFYSAAAIAAADKRGSADTLNKSAYAVSLKGSAFQTTSYYDSEGSEVEMLPDSDFKMMNLDLGVSYGISNKVELTGLARVRQVTSTINGTDTSASGLESLGIYAKYSFPKTNETRYAVGVHYSQTLYDNEIYNSRAAIPADEHVLGDSGSQYGIDLLLSHGLKAWRWDFRVGYNNPGNDLSEEITYQVEGSYNWTKLSLFAGVEGIHSLSTDPFSDAPATKPFQATGATALFNSINRERILPYLGAAYALDSVNLFARGGSVVKGQSTDRGNFIELGLRFATSGVTKESIKIESFKEYTIDGSVLKVSARGNFIRIDQGLSTDVEKGMRFDVYQTDYFGGNVLVATGVVYEVGSDWSVIKLVKKYNEIAIKPGFAARGIENP